MKHLTCATLLILAASPVMSHAKQSFGNSVMSAPLELQNLKVPIKSDGRLYHEKMFSFDATGEFDVPTVMTKADNSLCWIASTRNVSGENKLTISKSPSGYYMLGGSKNGRDLISGSGVSGSAICGSRYDAVMTEPPMMSVSCSNEVGKKCYDSKLGNPNTDITAEVKISAMLQNCQGCSAKFTKVSGDFELSSVGNTATASTTRSGTNPGTSSELGQVRVDLLAENNHVIASATKDVELHAVINQPSMSVSCGAPNCTESVTGDYGSIAQAKIMLKAAYSNCPLCKIRYRVVSGDFSTERNYLEEGNPVKRLIIIDQRGDFIGTRSKSGIVRIELLDETGRHTLAYKEQKIEAKYAIKSPNLTLTCNSVNCSDEVIKYYKQTDTATATASVSASYSNCPGCKLSVVHESGAKPLANGNSRALSVTQTSKIDKNPDTSSASSKLRYKLLSPTGEILVTKPVTLTVSATVRKCDAGWSFNSYRSWGKTKYWCQRDIPTRRCKFDVNYNHEWAHKENFYSTGGVMKIHNDIFRAHQGQAILPGSQSWNRYQPTKGRFRQKLPASHSYLQKYNEHCGTSGGPICKEIRDIYLYEICILEFDKVYF